MEVVENKYMAEIGAGLTFRVNAQADARRRRRVIDQALDPDRSMT